MASLVDVFVQNKTTSIDVPTSTSKDDGVKETPSLFDSLLSDSTKKLEKSQEEIKPEEIKPTEKNILEEAESLDTLKVEDNDLENSENKIESKTQEKEIPFSQNFKNNKTTQKSTSLLDRLVIEAKSEISEENGIPQNPLDKLVGNLEKSENELTSDNKKVEENSSLITNEETVIIPETNSEDIVLGENIEEISNIEKPILETKNRIKEKINIDINDIKIDNKVQVVETNNENIDIKNLSNNDLKIDNDKKEIKTKEIKTEEQTKSEDKIILNLNSQEFPEVITPDESIVIENNKIEPSINTQIIDDALVLSPVVEDKKLVVQNKIEEKAEPKKSLMDYLIEKNSENSITEMQDTENVALVQEKTIISNSKDFVSSLYLGEQKNSMVNQFLFNKNEAMKLLQNGSISLEDIEKSANILNLELDDVSIEQDNLMQTLKSTKQDVNLSDEKKNILDTMLNEKNIRSADVKNLITQSVEASNALLDNTLNVSNDVTIDVSPTLLNNLQSRIIGAKQQMSQMMSDVARQMYENYKPPVTVFKINLNPVELGSIAILMKNDKNNSLNISMSVSNVTTLDTLLDNQNILRNSLSKTFNENTQFNLDFSSSSQSNSGSGQQQSSNKQNRKYEDKIDTQSVLKLKEENRDRDDSLDYM
ncbi:flagellar hook-length control protein FliK [Arcobacter lacus]|uniref:flagellar hook-length control protein FliK n=1 Tax=Arcobacter lacus TaxID=1912876 RepID=UPI0021BB7882|nr:flagellar hook-length control protein FliK [Arcobacter lacus]MCT7911884.1 flagellar hook-length control protein FliK [Arcobacter lacus]